MRTGRGSAVESWVRVRLGVGDGVWRSIVDVGGLVVVGAGVESWGRKSRLWNAEVVEIGVLRDSEWKKSGVGSRGG